MSLKLESVWLALSLYTTGLKSLCLAQCVLAGLVLCTFRRLSSQKYIESSPLWMLRLLYPNISRKLCCGSLQCCQCYTWCWQSCAGFSSTTILRTSVFKLEESRTTLTTTLSMSIIRLQDGTDLTGQAATKTQIRLTSKTYKLESLRLLMETNWT